MKSIIFGLFLCISAALACTNPKISDVQTFSTQDTNINTETAYVVQFRAQCGGNTKHGVFFAEVNGKLLPSSVDESGEKYQISWTEENKLAKSGEVKLRLFDDEGYSALKKAQRNNEDLGKVKELRTVSFYHQGTYRGPYLQSELVVIILFAFVYYCAYKHRSDIQA